MLTLDSYHATCRNVSAVVGCKRDGQEEQWWRNLLLLNVSKTGEMMMIEFWRMRTATLSVCPVMGCWCSVGVPGCPHWREGNEHALFCKKAEILQKSGAKCWWSSLPAVVSTLFFAGGAATVLVTPMNLWLAANCGREMRSPRKQFPSSETPSSLCSAYRTASGALSPTDWYI